MEISKQEKVLNDIIYSITHSKKVSGDFIFKRDYPLSNVPMSAIFKILRDKEIIRSEKTTNSYILTDNCIENAKEMYLEKIAESIQYIKLLADTANIPNELLNDIFREEVR